MTPRCRHCAERKVTRPRGLCEGCYQTPGVRDLYPVRETAFTRRGPDARDDAPAPADPTAAPPGSLGKMRVMRRRLLRGEQLHHPADERRVDDALTDPFRGHAFDPAADPDVLAGEPEPAAA